MAWTPLGKGNGPLGELTSPKNKEQMATFRRQGVAAFTILDTIRSYYEIGANLDALPDPNAVFVDSYTERSKSIEGEFRKDFIEGAKADTPHTLGVALQQGSSNGNQNGGQVVEVRKRGM